MNGLEVYDNFNETKKNIQTGIEKGDKKWKKYTNWSKKWKKYIKRRKEKTQKNTQTGIK